MRFIYRRNDSVSSESNISSISSSFHLPVQNKGVSATVFEIIDLLKKWRAENENQLYTLVEVSCAVQQVLLQKDEKKTRKWLLYWIALIAFFAVFSASIGCSILAMRLGKNQRMSNMNVVGTTDGNRRRNVEYYSYVPLEELSSLDLNKIEKMGSLILQWGTPGNKNSKSFFFSVLSAFKNTTDASTTLNLSSGYKFVATPDEAILYDGENNEVGVIKFPIGIMNEKENIEEETLGDINVDSDNTTYVDEVRNDTIRRLGLKKHMKGGLPNLLNDPVDLSNPFDDYCRYGCGAMSVTFPYYYRPFFGYGFPLIGTESMFPQGYGGYGAAPLLARQAELNRANGGGRTVTLNGNNLANGF